MFCSQAQKEAHVETAGLCPNCLNPGHNIDACFSKGRCLVCGEKHNTKLHVDKKQEVQQSEATSAHASLPDVVGLTSKSIYGKILATAYVMLQAPNSTSIMARALIDPGSEESFVSERIAQALSLPRKLQHVVVTGLGCTTTAIAKSRVYLTLKSRQDTNFLRNFTALVLKKLTNTTPHHKISLPSWAAFDVLDLADPDWKLPAGVDCLLDAEAFACIIRDGIVKGPPMTHVTAVNSVFGWLIVGGNEPEAEQQLTKTSVSHASVSDGLTEVVKKFWESEEIPFSVQLSPMNDECYKHFKATHTCNEEGRFIVRLQFRNKHFPSNTRPMAEACLKRIERRFGQQPDMEKAYKDFMQEYIDLHHMELVNGKVKNSPIFYLPHHPVFKKDGSKKIRVIFNASHKNAQGITFNSMLHTGPKLQEDVLDSILRWSFFRFVFSCDVAKMFRQFLVHPDDCHWQRIVWRNDPNELIQAYRLLTVTYGEGPAPFLSNACMLQLADDEQLRFRLQRK